MSGSRRPWRSVTLDAPSTAGWRVCDRGPLPGLVCTEIQAQVPWRHWFGLPQARAAAPRRSPPPVPLPQGFGPPVAWVRQVHGTRLVEADPAVSRIQDADGILLRPDMRARSAGVWTADCVPVVLGDRRGRAVAVVHAGWRGIAGGILAQAVSALTGCGLDAGDLLAVLGPSIGPCCFPVGEDVAARLAGAASGGEVCILREADGRPRPDLRALAVRQLAGAGVPEDRVHVAPWCTGCHPAGFASYRRDGDKAGRMLSLVGYPPSDGS